MLVIHYSASFEKRFETLSEKTREKALDRIELFREDMYHPILKNHPLRGEYEGCRSINVSGDIRIIYEDIGNSEYLLHDIGTHSQLYE